MYNISDNPPNLELHLLVDFLAPVGVVLRYECQFILTYADSFDGKLAVDNGYNNILISGLDAPVDDQQVPIVNSRFEHRIARNPDKERGRRVLYKMPVQIELSFLVIGGRGRESCRHRRYKNRLPAFRRPVRLINYLYLRFHTPYYTPFAIRNQANLHQILRLWAEPIKKGAYAELIGIGPEIIQILLLFSQKQCLLFNSLSRLIQTDVVNIHLARTAGYRHVALCTQANGNPVNIGQNDTLIGKD